MVASIIGAKVWEDKYKRKSFILKLVSIGDERVRLLSNEVAHVYAELKADAEFFINKQAPLHVKNFVNKTNLVIKERMEKHIGDIRGSRFLKKSDGISEFLKSLSEKETDGSIEAEEVE